jgi:hypothetical protein
MDRVGVVNGAGELEASLVESSMACLSCGAGIVGALSVLGSLRCLDCRSANSPLDPWLVEHAERPRRHGGPSAAVPVS